MCCWMALLGHSGSCRGLLAVLGYLSSLQCTHVQEIHSRGVVEHTQVAPAQTAAGGTTKFGICASYFMVRSITNAHAVTAQQ
jgi:hypothetical protein